MPSEDSLAEPVSTAHFTGQQSPYFTCCHHSSARFSVALWCPALPGGGCVERILHPLRGTCAKLRASHTGGMSPVGQASGARKTLSETA